MSNRTPEQWRARAEGLERSLDALQREHARVKRQRQELEQLRDTYVKRAISCREQAAAATKFFERRNALRFAHSYTLTHEALTRILEGTHE